jgi:hypothetical protein
MAGTSPAKTKLFGRFPLLFGRKIFPGQPCASGGGLGWGLSAAKRVSVIGRLGLCVLVLSVALAGCGKRNAPTAPPDQPDTYPRPYPSE